jgi:archaellum biogenesis ATPase FlaH
LKIVAKSVAIIGYKSGLILQFNKVSTAQITPQELSPQDMFISLDEMINQVAGEPQSRYVYSGIMEGTVGVVFGPSKSGKTMFCEGLGMAIASGQTSYLGHSIDTQNKKVLIMSFEEFYKNRTDRNKKQVNKLTMADGRAWVKNYMVITKNMPTYISTPAHWNLLKDVITISGAGVIILDSLTRMCEGIEDSAIAQAFMRKLKALALQTKTTIIAIHHTTKLYGAAITMDSMAGSRVMSQELEFAIGVNRTSDGKRYIKDVFFRYAPCDDEKVQAFTIDASCSLIPSGKVSEAKLLQCLDGRRDESNGDKIANYLKAQMLEEGVISSDLEKELVPRHMSRATLFNQLKKLKLDGVVTETDGKYKLAA